MAIYVAQNNAILLKKDRSVAELYKGDKRLFGYNGSGKGKIITVENVHPIKHNLKLKLHSDILADFSDVTLTKCGKNIMPTTAWSSLTSGTVTYIRNDDGTLTLSGQIGSGAISTLNLNTTLNTNLSFLKPNTDYAFSLEGIDVHLCLETKTTAGVSKYYSYGDVNFPENETPNRIFFQIKGTSTRVFENIIIKPQIEVGTVSTEFEAPTRLAVNANKDGTVVGFTSISPKITLFTNDNSVEIDCKYVKN
jgi:hypothetical protein